MDKKVFSKRFFGDKKILMRCNFIGAASNKKQSKMKMLYSAFQNKTIKNIQSKIVAPLKNKQSCGKDSDVKLVQEKYIEAAIEVATYFNITFEPSGISGFALFLQILDKNQIKIHSHDKIIVVNTGKSVASDYY